MSQLGGSGDSSEDRMQVSKDVGPSSGDSSEDRKAETFVSSGICFISKTQLTFYLERQNSGCQSSSDDTLLQSVVSFDVNTCDDTDPFEINLDDLRSDDKIHDQKSEDEIIVDSREPIQSISDEWDQLDDNLPENDWISAKELQEMGYIERNLNKFFQMWDHPFE